VIGFYQSGHKIRVSGLGL